MPRSTTQLVVGALLALLTTSAVAEPAPLRRHSIYVEAFGKGGVWGLGYDLRITERMAVGIVASYLGLDGQRMMSATPYFSYAPIGHHDRWFIDAGPHFVDLVTPSPVPEWAGTREAGVGAEVSTGYEHRGRVFFRVYAMGIIGGSGVSPWLGTSLGWTL
ncbi:MAG: hypothetical protein NT062_25830 [Proteobacteria bacterium]|nr:hypothetical protein [Pseudomonadota bacterium]